MNTVKMKFLTDVDMGEIQFKKGEITTVSTKGNHHLQYIKSGVAEIIQPAKKAIKKQMEQYIQKETKKEKKEPTEKTENKTTETILKTEIIGKDAVYNSTEPKWLIIKKTTKTDSTMKEILTTGESHKIEEIKFDLEEPDQWKCNKCKAIIKSQEEPIYCTSCNRDARFKQITQQINTKRWKLPRWKEINIHDKGMLVIYSDLVNLLKKCIVFSNNIEYEIFALWIMATYKREAFNSISFLMFQGLIESGKTRGLDLLREIGYQMIHTTGVTFPAMYRYTDQYHAGILIDEIDNKIDQRTESGRAYLDFLKPSYRKGSIYATADKESQDKTHEYENYGFKAFAGEMGGNDPALRSRCIVFKMEQSFPEIPDLKYIQDEIDDMQNYLFNYRYKTGEPPSLPFEFDLKGRDRELFSCLIQIAQHIGLDYQHILDFINRRTQEKIETLQESDEYFVLKAVYLLSTQTIQKGLLADDAPEEISYSDIAEECGWDDSSDASKQKKQKIGYIFKKLQLKTKRKRNGSVLLLNDNYNLARLPNLYRRFYVT